MKDFHFRKIHDELICGTLGTALRKIVRAFAIPIPAFDELTFDPLNKKRLHALAWSLLNNKYNWN